MALDYKSFGLVLTVLLITPSIFRLTAIWLHKANTICNETINVIVRVTYECCFTKKILIISPQSIFEICPEKNWPISKDLIKNKLITKI